MSRRRSQLKFSEPVREWTIAAGVVTAAIGLAIFEVWVFRGDVNERSSSPWKLLLADRATLGFLRLLLATAALYGIASIAVWVVGRRWLRSISTTGIEAGSASFSEETIEDLRTRLQSALDERDALNRLLWRYLRG